MTFIRIDGIDNDNYTYLKDLKWGDVFEYNNKLYAVIDITHLKATHNPDFNKDGIPIICLNNMEVFVFVPCVTMLSRNICKSITIIPSEK